ncbi:hypothetical protein Bca4012_040804 [Brassica carinata]
MATASRFLRRLQRSLKLPPPLLEASLLKVLLLSITEENSSVLQEDEFHRLANVTINNLLEKIEDYGDNVQIDGFDIDYGNEVLTLKLGSLGTYVLNKQTPNRQIWMSSPVSGPSRFDWDRDANAWVYRRTEAKLHELLEEELENLCGEPIQLS